MLRVAREETTAVAGMLAAAVLVLAVDLISDPDQDLTVAVSRYNPDLDIRVPPCRCHRGARPCVLRITQEDMRCDTCRAGCSTVVICDVAGNEYTVYHTLTDFEVRHRGSVPRPA